MAVTAFPLYLRRDLLLSNNLSAPVTWEDLADLVERLNGTDMNGDGVGDYG